MPIPFLFQLVIGIGLSYLGYLLAPKPKQPKLPELEDLETATAESGRPIPVLFGTMTISGLNLLGAWDKERVKRKVRPESKSKK